MFKKWCKNDNTDIFLFPAMAIAKTVKCFRVTIFDLVTLVQTLQRLKTTTNSVIVTLRFSLFAIARSSKSSVIDFQGQVSYRKRFMEEFGEEEHLPSKVPKPGNLVLTGRTGFAFISHCAC